MSEQLALSGPRAGKDSLIDMVHEIDALMITVDPDHSMRIAIRFLLTYLLKLKTVQSVDTVKV